MNRTFTVIDLDGEWVKNPHAYPFFDPSTGLRFDPAMSYKVRLSDWVKGQIAAGVLAVSEDMEKAAEAQAAQEAADQARAAEEAARAAKAAEDAAAAEAAAAKKAGKR